MKKHLEDLKRVLTNKHFQIHEKEKKIYKKIK